MYYLCILICFANYPVWSVLFQVTTVEWSHLMMPRPAPSSSWIHNTSHIFSVIYLFQIFCLFVNSVVVVLSCTHDIYCMMMAHPGRGTPPLWLFLRLLPFFFPASKVFFPHSNRGSKDRGCCCTILYFANRWCRTLFCDTSSSSPTQTCTQLVIITAVLINNLITE